MSEDSDSGLEATLIRASSVSGPRFCPQCGAVTTSFRCERDGSETVEMPAPTLEPALRDGTVLLDGRYTVLRRLGEGGMGSVFLAEQAHPMPRRVAIKVVREQGPMVERFYREARALSVLNHPNIVSIHEFAVDPRLGLPLLVMAFVDGMTLNALVETEGPLAPERIAEITKQIARALSAAHAGKIVHRDLKPENVIVSELPDGSDHVKVVDFGIAKSLEQPSPPSIVTLAGMIVGSPHFMSPEQISEEPVTPRSDLYALGAMIHFMATGAPPYVGKSAHHIFSQHVQGPIPELPDDVGERLSQLGRALLAKAPDDRPRSASEVIDALEAPGSLRGASSARVARNPADRSALDPEAGTPDEHTAFDEDLEYRPRRISGPALLVLLVTIGAGLAFLGLRVFSPSPVPSGMLEVAAGSFFMGCARASDPGCQGTGRPAEVDAFAIDRLEVSVSEYRACVEAGACSVDGLTGDPPRMGLAAELSDHCNWGRDDRAHHPINCVSWYQAVEYCAFRSARLPTEKEWERAARGVDARRYPWGHEAPVERRANLLDRTAHRKLRLRGADRRYTDLRATTGPVGEILAGASPAGALDMLGNVWEWTAPGPKLGPSDDRAFRGASFMEPPWAARVTSRVVKPAVHRGAYLGFRCAVTL
ncbi:MAG: bifunctional serine/threonine-protein kinase/formylglycine-generating enzyme family protein [Myxococcota bacterium]